MGIASGGRARKALCSFGPKPGWGEESPMPSKGGPIGTVTLGCGLFQGTRIQVQGVSVFPTGSGEDGCGQDQMGGSLSLNQSHLILSRKTIIFRKGRSEGENSCF